MADIMLKDLETSTELDSKALAKLIGGRYGGGMRKKHFYHHCAHHWHHHHHGHHDYGHWKGYRRNAYKYYKKQYC